jgi:hypothetical protein
MVQEVYACDMVPAIGGCGGKIDFFMDDFAGHSCAEFVMAKNALLVHYFG